MEALLIFAKFLLLLAVLICVLIDFVSASRAFDSRINRSSQLKNIITKEPIPMIYVFSRWRPRTKFSTGIGLPTIFYIACENRSIAEKLNKSLPIFGIHDAKIIDMKDIGGLKNYISDYYELADFELSEFPIEISELLEYANDR